MVTEKEPDIVDLNDWLSVSEAVQLLAEQKIQHAPAYLYQLAERYTPRPEGVPWEAQKGLKSRMIKTLRCIYRADLEAYVNWKLSKNKARTQ